MDDNKKHPTPSKKPSVFEEDGVKYNPYSIDKASKIPAWIKSLFLKFWLAGAVYFFIGWGLPLSSSDQFDLIFALGIAHGLATDLIANKLFLMMQNDTGIYNKYMMFCSKKFYSLFINALYSVFLAFCAASTYVLINLSLNALNSTANKIYIGGEPILYGIIVMSLDMLCLLVKAVIKKLFIKEQII